MCRYRHAQLLLPAAVRQQGDKGIVQVIGAGLLAQLGGGAGSQHFAGVHGHQPVVAFGFFHVGGGYQHAHPTTLPTDGVDQVPEAFAGERVYAGGGLVQNQQVRVVDKCAAQAQFLFHTARQFAGGAVPEGQQASGIQQAVDLLPARGASEAEQIGKEGNVLVHRQGVVQVATQALGHIGNARGRLVAKPVAGHVAAQHLQATLL